MDTQKLFRYASPLITLFLLAVLAFQVARLVWHTLVPINSVQVTTITPEPRPAWLGNLQFIQRRQGEIALNNVVSPSTKKDSTPIDNWMLKGVYAERGDSVAIIQTPQKSYVAEVGDSLEEGYSIVGIDPERVTLRDNTGKKYELLLPNNHLENVAANTISDVVLPARTTQPAIAPRIPAQSSRTKTNNNTQNWLQHLAIQPYSVNKQRGLQLSAKSTEGFGILRKLGLRQGDILLTIDDKAPTPELWASTMKKWQRSEKIRAKIMRHGTIETIIIKNTQ